MNQKKLEEMGKRLVEILIEMGFFSQYNAKLNVGGINTDLHTFIALTDVTEKERVIQVINEALRIYESECLAKAWAKHKRESGT